MLHKILFIFLGMCGVAVASAQTTEQYSSNKNRMKGTFEQDTMFVQKWNRLAWQLASKRPDSTMYFANQALVLAERVQWKQGIAAAYFNKGLAYRIFGDYSTALSNYLKALDAFEVINDSTGIDRCYTDIATIYFLEENYEQALAFDLKSLAIAQRQNDNQRIARTLNNIGVIYQDKKDYIKALEYHKKALAIAEQLTDQRSIASSYHNLGEVYAEMGEEERGLDYLMKSLAIGRQLEANDFVANTYVVIASVYQRQARIQLSLEYAQKGFELAKKMGAKEYLKDASNILYADYKKQHNLQRALEFFELYVKYKDSLVAEKNQKNIVHLHITHELEKKQKALDLLASEHKLSLIAKQIQVEEARRNQIALYTLSCLFVLLCMLLYVLYMRNKEKKSMNEILLKSQQEIAQKNEELATQQQYILTQNQQLSLSNQQLLEINAEKDGLIGVVAHDLRAPLNRIKGFVQIMSYDEGISEEQLALLKRIERTCEGGISLIKDLLTISDVEFQQPKLMLTTIVLNNFIQILLENYYSQADRKQIQLHYVSKDTAHCTMITDESFFTRILDNLLSNAIKFSYPHKSIYVTHKDLGYAVEISIRDEGQGFSQEDQARLFMKFQRLTAKPTAGEESTGLGLAIVKSLVEKLQGKIHVVSEEGKGAEFVLTFPKNLVLEENEQYEKR